MCVKTGRRGAGSGGRQQKTAKQGGGEALFMLRSGRAEWEGHPISSLNTQANIPRGAPH